MFRTLLIFLLICNAHLAHSQAVTLNSSTTNCTQNGVCNGTFNVWVTGAGAGPYSFTFTLTYPNGFQQSVTVNSTSTTFSNLCPGTYTANMTWNAASPPVGVIVPDTCLNCTGGAAPGTGGAGTSGTIAQPCPQIDLNAESGSLPKYVCPNQQFYVSLSTTVIGWLYADFTWTITGNSVFQSGSGYAATGYGSMTGFFSQLPNNTQSWLNYMVCMTLTGNYAIDPIYTTPCNFQMTAVDQYCFYIYVPPNTINAGPDIQVCSGSPVTLSGSGGSNYAWSNGVQNNVPFVPTQTTTYTLNGNYSSNFPFPGPYTCPGTDQVLVTVLSNPAVSAGPDQTACAGNSITLSGSGALNYTWNNGVVNGVPFQPPFGTTNYTVTGVSANGCQSSDNVTVNVLPVPAVNAGSDLTICAGQSVTLSGSGATTYAWNNGVVNNVPFVPASSGTYTVTGFNGSCYGVDQMEITVLPNPVLDAGSNTSICFGDSVQLNASGTGSLQWQYGLTNGDYFTPSSSQYIAVSLTGGNNCASMDSMYVTVNPLPTVNAGLDQSVCQGETVTLNGSGAVSYVWDNGVTDGVGFVPLLGTTSYTVTGTDANGCEDTDQVNVTVNALPVVDAGMDQSVCAGQSVTLSGSGAVSYVWDNGAIDNIPFVPTFSGVYTVTGTDANGCQSTDQLTLTILSNPVVDAGSKTSICFGDSVQLNASGTGSLQWQYGLTNGDYFTPSSSQYIAVTLTDGNNCASMDSMYVTVNPLPTVDAGLDQSVCQGETVTLNGSGAVSYVWDNGVTDGVSFVPLLGTTSYTVTGTDANGCEDTDQVDVTVNALPGVDAGMDQSVCAGQSATLSGSGAVSYVWDNGVIDNLPFVPTFSGVYTVTGTDANGCQSTDQLTLTILSNPVVDAGSKTSICFGDSVQLNATGATSYVWSGNQVNGTYFTPGNSQYLTVVGTDANGCFGTDGLNLVVNPLPAIDAGSDIVLCDGLPIVLNASGNGAITWSNSVINGIPFYQPVGTQVYYASTQDSLGCVNLDSVLVTVEEAPVLSIVSNSAEGCAPLTVTFSNASTGNFTDCLWTVLGEQYASCSSVTVTFDVSGWYDVNLLAYSTSGCVSEVTLEDFIYVEPDPIASFHFTPENLTTIHSDVDFFNTSQGAVAYSWNFGDGSAFSFLEHPSHTYPQDEGGGYEVELVASSALGCTDTAAILLTVTEELLIYVPNTFTPDGDMANQVFKPILTVGVDPFDYSLIIFDRWGEQIFESNNVEIGWDGSSALGMCQDGTYVWRLEFQLKDSDERRVMEGHVNLLK